METYDTVGTALDRTHDTMPSGAADRAHSNMPAGPGERQRSGGAPRPVSGREDEILGQLRQESSAMQVRCLQHTCRSGAGRTRFPASCGRSRPRCRCAASSTRAGQGQGGRDSRPVVAGVVRDAGARPAAGPHQRRAGVVAQQLACLVP